MSVRSFTLGTVFGAMLAASIGAATSVDAGVNAARLEAARELIGAAVKIREFETMLRQVIQGFTAEVSSQMHGRTEVEVVRVMMEQARVAISENRGDYLEGIAHIYADHIRASDLKQATEFFNSNAGQRWSDAQDAILTDTIEYAAEQGSELRERIVSDTVQHLQSQGYTTRD